MTLTGLAGNLGQFIVIYISHTNHKNTEACKNNTGYLKCSKHTLTFLMSHKPLTCEELPMSTHSYLFSPCQSSEGFPIFLSKLSPLSLFFGGHYPISCSLGYIVPSLFNTKHKILSTLQYLKSVLWPKTVQTIILFPCLAFHASRFLFLRVVFTSPTSAFWVKLSNCFL